MPRAAYRRPRMIPDEVADRKPHSPAQDAQNVFEFQAHLPDDLLSLREIFTCFLTLQAVARTADGEALFVEKTANLANDEHVLALVVAAVAAALDGLELRKFLFPIAQHMRLDAAKVAHFADGEVALAGNRREFAVIAWFQHTPRLALLVSGLDET